MITVDAECISLQDHLLNNLAVKYPNSKRANQFWLYFIITFFEEPLKRIGASARAYLDSEQG